MHGYLAASLVLLLPYYNDVFGTGRDLSRRTRKKTFAPHNSSGWQHWCECYEKRLEHGTSFRFRINIVKKIKIPPITEDDLSTGGGLPLRLLMDDEEDDMFRPISRCWGTPFMDVKFEDRTTQTNSSAVAPGRGSAMLPCRLAQEPRPFFRGNAGFRWHFPALFEPTRGLGGLEDERDAPQPEGHEVEEQEQEQGEEDPRLAHGMAEEAHMSVEAQIGRKLREIGDHFNQDQLQLLARHQRDHLPLWWRVGTAVFSYLFQRVDLAPPRQGNPR